MKIQSIGAVLTIVNLGLLAVILANGRPAQAGGGIPILRGRGLEIVDDQGRVRASIKLHAADPAYKWPDGRIGTPETIVLRLIAPNGRPSVKMGASLTGGGLALLGENDGAAIQAVADGSDSYLRVKSKDGKQQMLKP